MAWFRWHEGSTTDPKFHLIARKSGQPVAFCIAVWAMLLERASQAGDRGSVEGFDCESADAAMSMPDGAAQAIYDAMTAKGMILDGRISKWEERQPVKEDDGTAERKRRQRERERQERLSGVETGHEASQDVTPSCDMSRNVTQCHAASRNVTTDKIRIDKNIKGNLNTTPHPLQAVGDFAGGNASPLLPPDNKAEPPGHGTRPDGDNAPASGAHAGMKEANSCSTGDNTRKSRKLTGNSMPELSEAIASYTQAEGLQTALEDFRAMRERIRKPLTGKALQLLFRELDKLAQNDDALKTAILEQSILHGWQGVFPLRTAQPARASPFSRNGDMPATPTEFQKNMQDQRQMSAMLLQMRARKRDEQNGTIAIDGNAVAKSDGGQSGLPGGTCS